MASGQNDDLGELGQMEFKVVLSIPYIFSELCFILEHTIVKLFGNFLVFF